MALELRMTTRRLKVLAAVSAKEVWQSTGLGVTSPRLSYWEHPEGGREKVERVVTDLERFGLITRPSRPMGIYAPLPWQITEKGLNTLRLSRTAPGLLVSMGR